MKSSLCIPLFVPLIFTNISCQKEAEHLQSREPAMAIGRAQIVNANNVQIIRGGGGDDEEPIILGIVKDAQDNSVASAVVDLIPEGETTPTDTETTDSQGAFQFQIEEGTYFFRVTATGFPATETNPVSISGDTTYVVLQI